MKLVAEPGSSYTVTMYQHLVKALVDTLIFIEFSDAIHEDDSVKLEEQIANELQQMSQDNRLELMSILKSIADQYGDKTDFVKNLPETLGLN